MNSPNMSNDNKEEGMHIYLKSDTKTDAKVLEGSSVHERYIILMNDSLHQRADKDLCTIKELKTQVSELEAEIDSADTRRNYIKSLLKNFHEMHKMNEKLVIFENGMKKETQYSIKSYKARLFWHLRILHTIFVGILGLSWEISDVWNVTILGCVLAIVVAFHYSMMQNLRIPLFTEREDKVKALNKEKKKILDAQDYIHEFIESQ
jgi:hypothetical protein